MAGLTVAWELTRPDRPGPRPEVTVVQRGARPGGKAASSRGRNGRIEEHGLHVWLGYYDNAFRMIRECYEELDRPRTDPSCPVRTWRDAFSPAGVIGVADPAGSSGLWTADFAQDERTPGDPEAGPVPGPVDFVVRALALIGDLLGSVASRPRAPVTLFSSSPVAPPTAPTPEDLTALARALHLSAVAVAARTAATFAEVAAAFDDRLLRGVATQLDSLSAELTARLRSRPDGHRLLVVVDLLLGCVRGIAVDRLVDGDRGFAAVDDIDFRDWLARHGVAAETLESGIITGMYDLVFAYEGGDPGRPRFAAGQGLDLATRFFFAYRGSLFWKMRAGMGDVVIAPLVQVLTRRGVTMRLRTEVDRLELDPRRPRLVAVHLRRQDGGRSSGDPLVRFGGLPCFPTEPDRRPAIADPSQVVRLGRDVDVVVLATSVGAIPLIGAELLERSSRWRDLCDRVGTVSTAAAQLWFRETEAELGWRAPGATTAAWGPPFDTHASMSHLLTAESWAAPDRPHGLAYLCGVIPDAVARGADAGRHVEQLLDGHIAGGLRRALPALGPSSVLDRFTVASTDPSDRYVQSLPGSRGARLAAAGSGFEGLVVAGDWTDNGVDAGCIEAAVVSGIQAANAVSGVPPEDRVMGGWRPRQREEARV